MKEKDLSIFLLVAAVAVGLTYSVILFMPSSRDNISLFSVPGLSSLPELSTEGFTQASVSVAQNELYFVTNCHVLAMSISETQALSIALGAENAMLKRPLTHDLIRDMSDWLGIEVLLVKIDNFTDSIYRAKLVMKHGKDLVVLDSRPSDAVAIAVRKGTSIYVKDDILNKYAEYTC